MPLSSLKKLSSFGVPDGLVRLFGLAFFHGLEDRVLDHGALAQLLVEFVQFALFVDFDLLVKDVLGPDAFLFRLFLEFNLVDLYSLL